MPTRDVAPAPAPKKSPSEGGRRAGRPARIPFGNRALGRMMAAAGGEMPGAQHARRAVARAVPGRMPFADRIHRETGGRVDARSIPVAVVPGLSSRGVAFGGRIALRPDAGIEVARHELSHVLGADEATARRAERDPRVLAGMRRGKPRDGWDRDPKFNYLRLYIEDLYVDVEYDPKKATETKYVKQVISQAIHDVKEIISVVESKSVDWKAFELNLTNWMGRGFDGMFPLFDAVAGKDDGTLEVDPHHDEGSVGQENEIRSAIIEGDDIKYDATLAQTKAVSSRVRVGEDGTVEKVPSRWPLMRVSADQVKAAPKKKAKKSPSPKKKSPPMLTSGMRSLTFSPDMLLKKKLRDTKTTSVRRKKTSRVPKKSRGGRKRGVIELIFGPISSSDVDAATRRAKATKLFIKTVRFGWGEGPLPFEDFAGAYNSEIDLAATDDAAMADYRIKDIKKGVLIACKTMDKAAQVGPPPSMSEMQQSIQTSVEVSAVKLGDVNDETYLALWDTERENERQDRLVFIAARKEANAYVDEHLRPRVAALSGGVYNPKALDLSRLNSVFTLALFQIAKASDTLTKAASPVMEKAGFGDQMREILDARDKAALWDLINPGKDGGLLSTFFKKTMLAAAARVWKVRDTERVGGSGRSDRTFNPLKGHVQMRLNLFSTATETVKGRYGTTFGRKDDDPRYWKQEDEVESGKLGMKWDFRGRQRVFGKDSTQKGGTSAGKPIPMTYRMYHGRGLLHRDPRLVVEIRGGDNRINTTHEKMHTGEYRLDGRERGPVSRVLRESSKAPELKLAPGPSMMVEPKKHTLSYPDETQDRPRQFMPIRREESSSTVTTTTETAPTPTVHVPLPPSRGDIMSGRTSGPPIPMPRMRTMTTLPTGRDPTSHNLQHGRGDAPVTHRRERVRNPRFDNPIVANFVVDLLLRTIESELPPELQDGPMRRRFRTGFRGQILGGVYGPVTTLAQPGNPQFRRLVADARRLLARLHPPTRTSAPKRTITGRTLKGI